MATTPHFLFELEFVLEANAPLEINLGSSWAGIERLSSLKVELVAHHFGNQTMPQENLGMTDTLDD